jgi:serine/threonine protein kinase
MTAKAMVAFAAHVMLIFRDVKTENFCFDCPGGSEVFIIDMGFARQAFGYYGFETYCTSHASFWGTPNYASLDSLRRHPQTPRLVSTELLHLTALQQPCVHD